MGQTLVPSGTECYRADRPGQETLPEVTSEEKYKARNSIHETRYFSVQNKNHKKDFVSVPRVYGSLRKYTRETQWLLLEGRSGGLEEAPTLFPQTPSPCVHYKLGVKMKPADPLTQGFYNGAQTL